MLGIIKENGLIEGLAEAGVILLLFLIRIEFSLTELVKISRAVFLGGYLQVFFDHPGCAIDFTKLRCRSRKGYIIGRPVAMSSTALVFQGAF